MLSVLRFLIGLNAAGLAIIVESWLNALVPNEQRGRVLTIYVLVYGLFFGAGQLIGQNLDVSGPELVFIAGMATTLALVPMVAIDVRAPVLPHRVHFEILKALRTSPASVLACLLNGLILTGFFTVGPLFGERIGFDQRHIVLLMACVSLGGLFLQWPIGYFSDKVDRLYALIGLGAGILAVAAALSTVDRQTPFLHDRRAVRGIRRPRRKPVRGGRRARERSRGVDRLRGPVLDAVVRLGARRRDRAHHRHLRHRTHRAARVLHVRVRAHHWLFTAFAAWRLYRRRSTRWSRLARNSSPIRRHRRKSTPGCRITAKRPPPPPRRPRGMSVPPITEIKSEAAKYHDRPGGQRRAR